MTYSQIWLTILLCFVALCMYCAIGNFVLRTVYNVKHRDNLDILTIVFWPVVLIGGLLWGIAINLVDFVRLCAGK